MKAHSMSQYRRLTAQGAEVKLPDHASEILRLREQAAQARTIVEEWRSEVRASRKDGDEQHALILEVVADQLAAIFPEEL